MTAHVHDPAAHRGGTHDESVRTGGGPMTASRPKWLLPGLAIAVIAGGLVVAGVVSLSTVLYAALFGGMLLMHTGGHGHGGHGGGHGDRGHGPHGGDDDVEDLSRRSSGSQVAESGSVAGLDQRVRDDTTTSETDNHDQHRAHGCH